MIQNYFIYIILTAWLIAVIVKIFSTSLTLKKFSLKYILKNGGMPSFHTTTISVVTIGILIVQGFSELFFLALVITILVSIDAITIRKNIEVQGKELNKLLKKPINISQGHTIFEVLTGLIIGAGSALVCGFIMGFLSF